MHRRLLERYRLVSLAPSESHAARLDLEQAGVGVHRLVLPEHREVNDASLLKYTHIYMFFLIKQQNYTRTLYTSARRAFFVLKISRSLSREKTPKLSTKKCHRAFVALRRCLLRSSRLLLPPRRRRRLRLRVFRVVPLLGGGIIDVILIVIINPLRTEEEEVKTSTSKAIESPRTSVAPGRPQNPSACRFETSNRTRTKRSLFPRTFRTALESFRSPFRTRRGENESTTSRGKCNFYRLISSGIE